MAVTHLEALRNTRANATDDHVNTGAGTAKLRLRGGTTTIVDFDLPNPAFGAAASGTIAMNGLPINATAVAAGTVDNAQVINRNGDVSFSMSVTGIGGGGDLEVSNVSIASAQECTLESFTYTDAP